MISFKKQSKNIKVIKPKTPLKLAGIKEYISFSFNAIKSADGQFDSSFKYLCFLFLSALLVTESGLQLILNVVYWDLTVHHLSAFGVIKNVVWVCCGLIVLYKLRFMYPRTWIDLKGKSPSKRQRIIIDITVVVPLLVMTIISAFLEYRLFYS
ncbi:hypothetical protein [Photobacterium leiognathi]|uniref:hypothetical protein n=1 Tax=Photobacterium leiognathi TaxID=553611 RepID=UPI0029825906|nr:hypothetical protein [Photobacterium leiognathi]